MSTAKWQNIAGSKNFFTNYSITTYQGFQSCVWCQNKNDFWRPSLDFEGPVLLFRLANPAFLPFVLWNHNLPLVWLLTLQKSSVFTMNRQWCHWKKTLEKTPTPSVGAFHLENPLKICLPTTEAGSSWSLWHHWLSIIYIGVSFNLLYWKNLQPNLPTFLDYGDYVMHYFSCKKI
jgi:hypothetical protein